MTQSKFQFGDLLSHELVPNELREVLIAQEKRLTQLQQEQDMRTKELAKLERERQPRQAKLNQLEGELTALTAQLDEVKADLENVLSGNNELAKKLKKFEKQLEAGKSEEEEDVNAFCTKMHNLDEEWAKLRSAWVIGKGRGKIAEAQSILRRNKDVNVKLCQRLQQLERQIFGVAEVKSEKH